MIRAGCDSSDYRKPSLIRGTVRAGWRLTEAWLLRAPIYGYGRMA
jgi:hypothetical protein